MKQKKLKVQYKSRFTSRGYTDTPMIQMTGNWLESLGFSIGDTVMMEYDETGIRIRPLTAAEEETFLMEEQERSIRKKQKEVDFLQKQIAKSRRQLSMVAEPARAYNKEVTA